MMDLFSRVRRTVALFVCPELGREAQTGTFDAAAAQGKGARIASNPELAALVDMPVLTFEALGSYVLGHDDPWQAVHDVQDVMRVKNDRDGGDDRSLGAFVGFVLAMKARSLPIAAGWPKCT
jgi:hypothetical protein